MATVRDSLNAQPAPIVRPKAGEYPAYSRRFDIAVLLTSVWLMAGVLVDTYAHVNLSSELESFFTPWHAVLYSGFAAVAVVHLFQHYRNVRRGYAWARALPRGYFLSLIGIAVFSVGGFGDMLWHQILGIEFDVEAAFSPTHLLIIGSIIVIMGGPLRAAWHRREKLQGWSDLYPAMLSAFFMMLVIIDIAQFLNTLVSPGMIAGTTTAPTRDTLTQLLDSTGVAGVVVPTAIWSGLILMMLKRWQLPFGAVTLMVAAPVLLVYGVRGSMSEGFWQAGAAVLVGALLADVLMTYLRPSIERVLAFRWFAFLMPVLIYGTFILSLLLTTGLRWRIHMWGGIIFVAGVVGLVISFLVIQPSTPEIAED